MAEETEDQKNNNVFLNMAQNVLTNLGTRIGESTGLLATPQRQFEESRLLQQEIERENLNLQQQQLVVNLERSLIDYDKALKDLETTRENQEEFEEYKAEVRIAFPEIFTNQIDSFTELDDLGEFATNTFIPISNEQVKNNPKFQNPLYQRYEMNPLTKDIRGIDGSQLIQPQKGYRNIWSTDELGNTNIKQEVIPGSEAAREITKEARDEQKTAEEARTRESVASSINSGDIRAIKSLVNQPGSFFDQTTGFWGTALSGVPGTEAYTVQGILEGIKGRIGFENLQAMREASPTGGAVGQVSNFENRLLQAYFGFIDQGTSTDQLLFALDRFDFLHNAIVNGIVSNEPTGNYDWKQVGDKYVRGFEESDLTAWESNYRKNPYEEKPTIQTGNIDELLSIDPSKYTEEEKDAYLQRLNEELRLLTQ